MVTAVLALAGCGSAWPGASSAASPDVRPGELDDAGGRPCPQRLPLGDDPSGHGFGTQGAAHEAPALLEPQEAWVCEYNTVDLGTTAAGGAVMGWDRAGQPVPVPAADLPALRRDLDRLTTPERQRGCAADLGPRWMVVYSHEGDLTGVVVDDYGCRDVRLTDDPHSTPPGADDQEGAVGGVLDGGAEILATLGVGRTG